jgi:hypothetical protein
MPVPCECGFSGSPTALKSCAMTPSRSGWAVSICESMTAIVTLAVDVGDFQLLQDVLRGVALWTGLAARGGRGIVALLVEPEDVLRLYDREELDSRKRLDDLLDGSAVGEA